MSDIIDYTSIELAIKKANDLGFKFKVFPDAGHSNYIELQKSDIWESFQYVLKRRDNHYAWTEWEITVTPKVKKIHEQNVASLSTQVSLLCFMVYDEYAIEDMLKKDHTFIKKIKDRDLQKKYGHYVDASDAGIL